jgi:mannosyltransferase
MTAVMRLGSGPWLLAVVLATVFGGTLRFAAIGQQSFWYDEAVGDALTSRGSYAEIITGQVRDNGLPPFYYITDKLASNLLGHDEADHRALPALFGTLSISLIAVLGRRLHSARVGVVAAWLLAISPFQIEMSNEARVYSFLHFITTLNALLFVRWLSSRSWRDGLAYAVGTTVACYSHYYLVFVILGQAIVVMCQTDRWRLFGRWCLLMGLAFTLWLPWAPAFLGQLTMPGNLSRMGGSWKTQFAATPVVFAIGRTFAWRDAGPVMLGISLAASLVGYWLPAVVGLRRPLPNFRVTFPLLSAWVLLPIILPLAASLMGKPVYSHRYGSVGLTGFLVAVAIGLTRLPRIARAVATLVILAATTYSLVNYYRAPIKDDWRSAARAILDDACGEQVVLTDSDIEAVPFLYYARKYRSIPHSVYGLMVKKTGNDLTGVRYVDGAKPDLTPRDYTAEILSAPCVTVGLCVPSREEEAYRTLFETHHYAMTKAESFYRIKILRFEKVPDKGK